MSEKSPNPQGELDRLAAHIINTGKNVHISYDSGGGGVGLHWSLNDGDWPYCAGGTLLGAITTFNSEHTRLRRGKLQKELKATYDHE